MNIKADPRESPSDWKSNRSPINNIAPVVLQPKQQSTAHCRASLAVQVEEEAEESIEVKDLLTHHAESET